MSLLQKCRVCGCTQNKINDSCIEKKIFDGEEWFRGCHWIEEDLCSGCRWINKS